ncbi:hypothetical protein [Lacticaseibacillus daqingensis]|uniref:hypothetical protein n=1 Tax=Lacticaseibacillus daqingensis TaxID=2486014 RepID=UPI000F794F2A|nr:hypothetical protein [Lacticaseibacillus daqingensis]
MTKLRTWLTSVQGRIIALSILNTLILPWGFTLFHLPVAYRVGVLFILLNLTLAFWIGRWQSRAQLPWWYSLILPLLFGAMVWLRFADYSYWFMPIYWVVTLLSQTRND